jgi:hypothetical protein
LGTVLVLGAPPKFKLPVGCVLLVKEDILKFVGTTVEGFSEIFVKFGTSESGFFDTFGSPALLVGFSKAKDCFALVSVILRP